MILLALLLFEDLICWNDRYIQLYLLAVSIDIYQVEYQISRTDMVSHITQLPQQHIAVSIKYCPGGHFYVKKIIFFPILSGDARRVRPPSLTLT